MRGFWVISLLIALAPLRLAAQSEWSSDDGPYRELIRRALQEYGEGNWAEAKLFFSDAHARYPNARTLRGLGLVAYAQRDYVNAIGYLETALVNTVQPLTPELREQIQPLLVQARRFVARVTVELQPADAELRVNEQPPARTPDGSVWLNPGTHELVARRDGYESAWRRVAVEAGTEVRVALMLRENAPLRAPLVAAAPAPVAPSDASDSASIAPYVVIGLSAAVAATGGVLFGVALSDIGDVERPRAGTEWSSVEGDYRRTPLLSGAGIALIAVGVAGIGAGIVWAAWPDEERLTVGLGPGGVAVRGKL